MNPGVIIGVIAFIIWGSASSWWYVCKIKGLCDDDVDKQVLSVENEEKQTTENSIQLDSVLEESFEEDAQFDIAEADALIAPTETEITETESNEISEPIELTFEGIKFRKNSDKILDESALSGIAQTIIDTLNSTPATITLTGHTCDLGSEAFNLQLGKSRAESVKRSILNEGVEAIYEIISKGESEPLNDNSTEEKRSLNRRVEIDIKTN